VRTVAITRGFGRRGRATARAFFAARAGLALFAPVLALHLVPRRSRRSPTWAVPARSRASAPAIYSPAQGEYDGATSSRQLKPPDFFGLSYGHRR
jgi:hypothetical protein